MSKALAIAARELQERWLLLPAGLVLGFVPLALPPLGLLPRDGAAPLGLLIAILLGGMAALLAGSSMFARDADDGRLAFLLGKPVSWPAIWAGKWIAAGLLAGASGLLASIPWMAVYPPETKASWWSTWDAQGWTFATSMIVLIVAFANFAATAFRARSKWLVLDLAFLVAAVWAVVRFVAPLVMVGVLDLTNGWGLTFLTALGAVPLLAASAAQVAIGRADLVRAHRALSVGFWASVFSLLFGAAGWLAWLERVAPQDLRQTPFLVRPAPDSRWFYVEGLTSHGGWYVPRLLVDSVDGRYLRTVDLRKPLWQVQYPGVGYSADGRFAVKWKEVEAATSLSLIDLQASPPRVTEVVLEGSAPASFWTAVCLADAAETALVVQESSASLVALPSGRALAASIFPPGWFVATARLEGGTARLWLARSDRGVATPVYGPAELRIIELTANASPRTLTVPTDVPLIPWKNEIVSDDAGERLLTRERGLVLRNGANGTVVARLVDGTHVDAARFLADGRIVALSQEGPRRVLRTFDADGSLAKRVELDLGSRPTAVALGPEVRPGQVVIVTGRPFLSSDSVIVDVPEGRVVERLEGLSLARDRSFADIQARSASQTAFPPRYFVSGSDQVVRVDFATGERRIVAGPGAPKGERLKGF